MCNLLSDIQMQRRNFQPSILKPSSFQPTSSDSFSNCGDTLQVILIVCFNKECRGMVVRNVAGGGQERSWGLMSWPRVHKALGSRPNTEQTEIKPKHSGQAWRLKTVILALRMLMVKGQPGVQSVTLFSPTQTTERTKHSLPHYTFHGLRGFRISQERLLCAACLLFRALQIFKLF